MVLAIALTKDFNEVKFMIPLGPAYQIAITIELAEGSCLMFICDARERYFDKLKF